MTDQEILQRAIEIAVENGWNRDKSGYHDKMGEVLSECEWYLRHKRYIEFLFSHPFAKALWGEKFGYQCSNNLKCSYDCNCAIAKDDTCCHVEMKNYEYHLSRMVLEENPLQYEPLIKLIEEHERA